MFKKNHLGAEGSVSYRAESGFPFDSADDVQEKNMGAVCDFLEFVSNVRVMR
jgi:hypothetical protein